MRATEPGRMRPGLHDPVHEHRPALLAREPQLLHRLLDAGEARMRVIVEHHDRVVPEHRPPGLELVDRTLALVGAVDVEEVDRLERSRSGRSIGS